MTRDMQYGLMMVVWLAFILGALAVGFAIGYYVGVDRTVDAFCDEMIRTWGFAGDDCYE